MKLSIIIPVFNEEKTIGTVIEKVYNLKIKGASKEIVVVDDGSTDTTATEIKKLKLKIKNFEFFRHKKNMGKGAAVKTAIENATGDYIIIQDADLEYDVNDIPRLFSNIKGKRDVIYGTRLNRLPNLKKEERRIRFLIHYLGNRFLSLLTSILYGQWITDMETCYKLFPKKVLSNIPLNSRGFEFEPEITAKLLKQNYKIMEIPIKTNPRDMKEGKKLRTFRDGVKALYTLFLYRF